MPHPIEPSRGSSPLTRGKLVGPAAGLAVLGLIPAHAGKTTSRPASTAASWAHPRSRGENGDGGNRTPRMVGSSPLTRGKPKQFSVYRYGAGLIPAHAGKTSAPSTACYASRAHPRSRGENTGGRTRVGWCAGSSPLTRGKHGPRPPAPQLYGLIPAHAGKTFARSPRSDRDRAHPRSRGENLEEDSGLVDFLGSSPLTRGKH